MFMVDSVAALARKLASITSPLTDVCVDVLALFFFPGMSSCIMARHLYLHLIYPKHIVAEVLLFVQIKLCKPELSFHVSFK